MEKVPMTGAERVKKYREQNPKKVELLQLRQNVNRQEKNKDPEKAAKIRETNKKRQAEYRARKRSKENIPPTDLSDVTFASEDEETNQNDVSNSSDTNGGFKTPKRKSRQSSGDYSSDSSTPGHSRQYILGVKIRKNNDKNKNKKLKDIIDENNELRASQDKHDGELAALDFRIKELEAIEEKLQKENKALKEGKEKNTDSWFGEVYKNLSADAKKEVKNAFAVVAPMLEKGTVSRLKRNIGINFSKALPENREEISDLKQKVVKFAENNTIDVPDKKKYKRGIRFRTASLLCLYNLFETEYPNSCTYQTFCKYWPAQFVKPCASEFGTCLCIYCQNIELKVNSLQTRKLISTDICLETMLVESRNGDFTLENQFRAEIELLADEDKKEIDVAYNQWEKVKQSEVSKNTGRVKGDKMMRLARHLKAIELGKEVLEEFEVYKEHLERDYVIKTELKEVRLEAMEKDDLAVLHIDWAEQHKLTEVKEIQSAFFNGRYAYDIHTGYCYTKEDNHGFASLSDSSDHKAEAINCALKQKIVNLVQNGKQRIVICSDSPTSQYRNSKNVYLMKKIAQEFNISIRLLFTEAGHGKSPCDGVGGNIKTQVEAAMLNSFGQNEIEAIHSVKDVKKLIEQKTNLKYHISIHTKEEIETVRNSMPKLGPLVGALKLHEVFISGDGLLRKKDLPTDTFYKQVTIRESRARRVEAEQNAPEILENQPEIRENVPEIQENQDVLNEAFVEVEEQCSRNMRNRIMTRAEVRAELEAELEADNDDSDYDDDDNDDVDDD